MKRIILDLMFNPLPYRVLFFRFLRKLKNRYFGKSYIHRAVFSDIPRPHYGYCMYHCARLAKNLGHDRVSVIEFGVAAGKGLVNIEFQAENIKKELNIDFDIFGFDMETGLPATTDYRDLPYQWSEGDFPMDREGLEKRLKKATLVIGDVNQTYKIFKEEHGDAGPIGCVFIDVDYYTSTVGALKIFGDDQSRYLPRVMCYFDDVLGTNEFIGELRAIEEFNETNTTRKIAKPHGFLGLTKEHWTEKIFQFHDFKHPQYNTRVKNALVIGRP